MISDSGINAVRYVISMAAYSTQRYRHRPVNGLIPRWLRKLCEELSVDYTHTWPAISSVDNPILCEFCGTQLGTHWASAVVRKGYMYDTCCNQLAVRPEQPQLFWGSDRLKIECAIVMYMNAPREIVQHCMALELLAYMQNKKDIQHERNVISQTDVNGFNHVNSLS
jgi:hypothetical protein